MPKEKIDWEQRGYVDYPDNHFYPYRDKYGPRIEKRYLTGWWKRARVALLEKTLEGD